MCEYQALQSVSSQLEQQLQETQEELETYKLLMKATKPKSSKRVRSLKLQGRISKGDITIEKKEVEIGPLKSQIAIKCHQAEKLSRQLDMAQMRKEMYRSEPTISDTSEQGKTGCTTN